MNNSAVATAEYTINTPGSSTTFKLVKNQSGLVDGKRYIIVCNDHNVAATDLGSNKYLGTTNVSISNEIIDVYEGNNNAPLIFTLEENDASNKKWELKSGSNYLTETKVKELAWSTNKGGETITISSDGTAKINFTNGYLKYNSSSPRFTTYASGQKDIQLYVEDDGNTPPATEYTITVNQPSEGGEISADYASAAEGTIVTLTAEALTSHTFGSWSVYKTGDENTTVTVDDDQFTMPAYDVTVTATFNAKPTNTITVNGGTANPTTAYEGQTVTVTPTIPEGKVLDSYTVNPTSITLASSGTGYTFTMPNEAVTVTFTFKDAPSGETTTATYIFNTDEGLADLGITKPAEGKGTEIAGNTYTVGQVSFTSTNGGNGKTVVYNSQGNTDLRVYRGTTLGTFTLSVPSGSTITKIEIAGNTVSPLTVSTGSYNNGTWNGNAEEVTFTVSTSNIRINTITVTYIAGEAPDVVEYYLAGNLNGWGNPVDPAYKFVEQQDGSFVLNKVLPDMENADNIRFKIAKVVNGGTPVMLGANRSGDDYGINWNNHTDNFELSSASDAAAFSLSDLFNTTFTLNATATSFTVNKPQLFLVGTFNSYATPNSSLNGAIEMTPAENGGWTLTHEFTDETEFRLYDAWHEYHGGNGAWFLEELLGTEFNINNDNDKLSIFHIVGDGNYTITVNSDITKLVADRVQEKYSATIASGINGGSVSFNANSQVSKLNDLPAGYTVNVFVNPQNEDWQLATLTYTAEGSTDAIDITATDDQYSFPMPAANVTINATFNYIGGEITETTYELVTKQSDLKVGDKYLIVNETASRAMGISGFSSDVALPITITNHKTTITSDSHVSEFVLGTLNGAFTFFNGDGYLDNSNGTGSGSINQYGEANDNIDWYVTIKDNGNTVTFQNVGTQYYLRYWHSNNNYDFRAYANETSNGSSVQLYKVATPPTEATLAVIESAQGVKGTKYAIADDYLVAVDSRNVKVDDVDYIYVWCKDDNNVANPLAPANEDIIDLMKKDSEAQGNRPWDQSNWVVLRFKDDGTVPTDLKGKKITGIVGTYVDDINYMIDVESYTKGEAESYTPNAYCVANFNHANWGANGVQQPNAAANAPYYFFMTPKVQEVCEITYAEWNGTAFTVPASSGFAKNTLTLGWEYNVLESGPVYQQAAEAYLNGNNEPDEYGNLPVYRFRAVVQNNPSKGAVSGENKVYPMNFKGESNIVTAINTIEVGNGQIKSVKYVNVAGVVSDAPFQGVNIVVTEYTDGSRTTSKMLRK